MKLCIEKKITQISQDMQQAQLVCKARCIPLQAVPFLNHVRLTAFKLHNIILQQREAVL